MTGRLPMLAVTIGVAAALIATIVLEPIPLYIWNASASVPIGLYRLRPADQFQVTELVAVQPPEPLATFLDLNGYLPIGVPMLKRVLALPGQSVCRTGLTISVDEVNAISTKTSQAMNEAAKAVNELAEQSHVLTGLIEDLKREGGR